MKITLTKDTQIGRKLHKSGTTLQVVTELGRDLVAKGRAWCHDESYPNVAIVPKQRKKKLNPKN